jgi:peptidoglycan/xylan/chitin deacetylase (PgdA/CDA1 family)
VAEEARAGYDVGDHTETHPLLSHLSPATQATEIRSAADAIRHAGAPYPRLFRPPYGSFNQATLGVLHADRMLMVLWTADTKDFSQPGAKKIVYAGISGGQPGAIVLMHDGGGIRRQTVAALPRIIKRLRERGFRLVTLSRLIADAPPPADQPPPHQLSGRV